VLVSEPHNVAHKDLADLDRWQAVALYFVQRDKKGHVVATGQRGRRQSEREGFYAFWRDRCLPRWRVDQLWELRRRDQERQRAEARARRRRRPKKGKG
jgi:hypothetical protein